MRSLTRLFLAAPFLICAFLPSPLRAKDEPEVMDLSDLVPPGKCRDQAGTEACHAFASIVLAEAALHDQKIAGRTIKLSAADLFVQVTVKGADYYRKAMTKALENYLKYPGVEFPIDLQEGGHIVDDLRHILHYGVALDETVGWKEFLKAYNAFRTQRKAKIDAKFLKCAKKLQGDLKKAGCADARKQAKRAQRDAAKKFLEKLSREDAVNAARTLEPGASTTSLLRERSEVKWGLEDFQIEQKTYATASKTVQADHGKCREAGEDRTEQALDMLDDGLPIAFGMDISGLEKWNRAGVKKKSRHYFAVTGYISGENDEGEDWVVFQTLNSWGGDNPSVIDREMCRVNEIVRLEE